MGKDIESERAAAQLYGIAQATALLRVHREHEGRDAKTGEEVSERVQQHPHIPTEPTEVEYDAVNRRYPHLSVS
jgi:hypothetical protein